MVDIIKVADVSAPAPRRGSGWGDETLAAQNGAGQDPLQDAEIVSGLHWLINAQDGQPREETTTEIEDEAEKERLRVWIASMVP